MIRNEIKNDMLIAMMDYGIFHIWQEDGKQFWEKIEITMGDYGVPRVDEESLDFPHYVWMDGDFSHIVLDMNWDDMYDVLSVMHIADADVGDPWKNTWFEL